MDAVIADHCPMNRFDLVSYQGRSCLLVGFTPMSVSPERVVLVDTLTGGTVTALPWEVQAYRGVPERKPQTAEAA
jgi:hypothetical protein